MKLVIDIPSHENNRLIFGASYTDDLRILVQEATELMEEIKVLKARLEDGDNN